MICPLSFEIEKAAGRNPAITHALLVALGGWRAAVDLAMIGGRNVSSVHRDMKAIERTDKCVVLRREIERKGLKNSMEFCGVELDWDLAIENEVAQKLGYGPAYIHGMISALPPLHAVHCNGASVESLAESTGIPASSIRRVVRHPEARRYFQPRTSPTGNRLYHIR